jgi:hypothetical protein
VTSTRPGQDHAWRPDRRKIIDWTFDAAPPSDRAANPMAKVAKAASAPAVGENAGKNLVDEYQGAGDALALTEQTSSQISEDR